jgi:toxin CcdB
MARFDVCRDAEGQTYLDVQANVLSGLNTRLLVPLIPPERAPSPARRLNPIFDIDGERLVMVTQYLAAVPTSELGPSIGSLVRYSDEISAALDMAFYGF